MSADNRELNESTVASNDLTIAGSHYDEEKIIDSENVLVAPINEAVAVSPEAPTDAPQRPTGIKFALIFVGYVPISFKI